MLEAGIFPYFHAEKKELLFFALTLSSTNNTKKNRCFVLHFCNLLLTRILFLGIYGYIIYERRLMMQFLFAVFYFILGGAFGFVALPLIIDGIKKTSKK